MKTVNRGFTLVELLVVIVILGILASLVIVGVTHAMTTGRIDSSRAMIENIRAALSSYHTRWGDYPPSVLDELKIRTPNDTNNGGEALAMCLASRRGGGILYQAPEEKYCNTDDDRVAVNTLDWFFGDNQLREIEDYFGRPLSYVHHKDYNRMAGRISKYKLAKGAAEVQITAEKSPVTVQFINPDRFQIKSVGPNGKVGGGDDIGDVP